MSPGTITRCEAQNGPAQDGLARALEACYDGNLKSAAAQLDEIVEPSDRIKLLKKAAQLAFEQDQFKLAREYFIELHELTPGGRTRGSEMNKLGICHMRLGHLDAAEDAYKSALGTSADAAARYNIACIRCQQNRPNEALDLLEAAIKSNPNFRSSAEEDDDLDVIRPYVRFEELVEEPENALSEMICTIIAAAILSPLVLLALPMIALRLLVPSRVWSAIYFTAYRPLLGLFGKSVDLHGLKVGATIWHRCLASEENIQQVDEALALIRRCDSQLYERIQSDLDRVLITEIDHFGGMFIAEIRSCHLNSAMFASAGDDADQRRSLIYRLASLIVHEASHARLYAMGIRNYAKIPHRHEQFCRKQEDRFRSKAASDGEFGKFARIKGDKSQSYTMYDRWYYERHGSETLQTRIASTISLIRGSSGTLYDEFVDHVWSSEDNYVEYIRDLDSLLDDRNRDPKDWFGRGCSFGGLRRYADGIRDLKVALDLDHDDPETVRWLAILAVRNGDWELAHAMLERMLINEPEDKSVMRAQIRVASKIDRLKPLALDYGELLVKAHPHSHGSYVRLAQAQLANGLLELAWSNVEKALDYHPDCRRGLIVATQVSDQMGSGKDAVAYWNRYREASQAMMCQWKRSRRARAFVITQSADEERIDLRLLTSAGKAPSHDKMLSLASRLVQSTDHSHESTNATKQSRSEFSPREDYLYSMVHRRPLFNSTFRLPTSVGDDPSLHLIDVELSLNCFRDCPLPVPLDQLDIYFDTTDLANNLAIVELPENSNH